MGLYGALVVQHAPPVSCGSPAPLREEVLLYSEIDPELHMAVDTGTYGTSAYPSTFDYQPKYFLINGLSFPDTDNIAIAIDEEVRLRFLNAGLKTHIPTIQGTYMQLEAEDGNTYPYKKIQYSIELTAAKTMDALIFYDAAGRYALYDRSLHLTNAGETGGGMLTYLVVAVPYPGDEYCDLSVNGPCSEGLGDCDGDSECESGLICAPNVGPNYNWPAYVDVCEMP
jgi:FtsP/CotA-like multicopper oxidase with cupredoxin domain